MKAFARTRRGRPKRAAANDNERDPGTPEAQAKRAALAQGADPAAAAHPLDLLLAHGLIEARAYRAGWRYAGLYRRVIGRADVSFARLYDGLRGEDGRRLIPADDTVDPASAQRHFRQAQAALRQEGPVIAGITERLVVFGAWPDWLLRPTTPRITRAHRELDLLRRGLALLTHDKARSQVTP